MLSVRQSVLWLALLMLACDASAPDRETLDLSPSTVGDPKDDAGDSPAAKDPDAGPCAALVQSAKVLLESHRTCQVDEDCRDEAIVSPCPAGSACSVFVRKDTDLLWSDSAKLEASYEKSCGKCAANKCGPREATRAFCDPSKHCAGRALAPQSGADAASPTLPADAATPAASTDASTGPTPRIDAGSGGSAAYACKVNLDCVITNVGNCCGYYPRCANVNATFAPPVCTGGQAGVCGFPSIDSCECRQNTCVTLQAGNPI